jgi:hypothetical protein
MQAFKNDETGYRVWLSRNPNGYVLQTTDTYSEDYQVLHRADCRWISAPGVSYTSSGLTKTVSSDRSELERLVQERFGAPAHECHKCLGKAVRV